MSSSKLNAREDTLQQAPICGQKMLLREAILSRHSTRYFRTDPVPLSLIQSALEFAGHAPSNSNIQAWRVYVVSGPALDRLKTALTAKACEGALPKIPLVPERFMSRRLEFGNLLYGTGYGVARDDLQGRKAAAIRNYQFFGAPLAVIVCMTTELQGQEALSVGMFLQSFLLGLTDMGIGSCAQISIAQYPEVVHREINIPDDLQILCGVSIGYEDEDDKVNAIRTSRGQIEDMATFLNE